MDILDILSANLRHFRTCAGYSQEKLAHACGLHRTYIGGIEQRRINVSVKNLQKIAEGLNVDAYRLLRPGEADPPQHD
ncbi:XRE family transcriptional regulator [Gordonibacter sp. 28C]|uniref:helix-turn-helix domain-containing protein n=1 Tax=Gordonibacter sp. 28C TaxID=2078569 RepID=UPI000DF83D67|nr:helix-turn-helix transcriptional regulator [Gordonibacter sp. 28C]RDB62618.1 XRE family transcriptional regulator [Gordonibacter sp. 28C]